MPRLVQTDQEKLILHAKLLDEQQHLIPIGFERCLKGESRIHINGEHCLKNNGFGSNVTYVDNKSRQLPSCGSGGPNTDESFSIGDCSTWNSLSFLCGEHYSES